MGRLLEAIGRLDMFRTFAHWLHDDTFLTVYIGTLVAVMVLPIWFLARWYHGNIDTTEGGRKLMRRQNAGRVGPRSLRGTGDAIGMARDIAAGRYGNDVKRMQNRVYIVCLAWILGIAALAGPLITAQALYPKPDVDGPAAPGATRNTR
jgi:hypothetical protein